LALDRQDIEKRDFPIGRRGYETEAVDAHLQVIAVEIETLKQQQTAPAQGAESLATVASEQVRAIVEAAETSAAGIKRDAEDEARKIRQDAADEAERARSDAASQAREHVAKVSEGTAVMLQRVDAMESELGALVESLRTGANRLTADLALLQGDMGELRATGTAGGQPDVAPQLAVSEPEPEPEPVGEAPAIEAEPAPEPAIEPEPEPEAEQDTTSVEPVAEADAPAEAEPEPAADTSAGDDAEGARLIALNMALNGTPREETDRYLAENFNLANREALLDEVYARIG
jgi:cell division septum initiation protein DivIVA